MNELGIGAGLGTMGFWLFIAVAVAASYWDAIKKRETQHETIRRVIESGQTIDEEALDRLMGLGTGGSGRIDRDFKVTALWMLPIAPGLAVMAYFLSLLAPEALYPVLGAAALVATMAIGFWVAGMVVGRWYKD
ncbi:MAG: hypothetical protein GKR91_12290 [Pseudomonadales bacterium]|nr:hypothetical protein [Pseudomonadales bacterium]